MIDWSNCHLQGYVLEIEMLHPMKFEAYLVNTIHCHINDGMNETRGFLHWPVGNLDLMADMQLCRLSLYYTTSLYSRLIIFDAIFVCRCSMDQ